MSCEPAFRVVAPVTVQAPPCVISSFSASKSVPAVIVKSPITFAGQLEGDLLLVHGTGDDNCHYQGTEALINELIAHNKQFSMLAYPGRTHAIAEGRGTTPHLYGLLTRFLHQHVPAGPK